MASLAQRTTITGNGRIEELQLARDKARLATFLKDEAKALSHEWLLEPGVLEQSFAGARPDAEALRDRALGLATMFRGNRVVDFHIPVTSGWKLIAPPYDTNWATGAGIPFSDWDGNAVTIGTEGYSASGFGLYLATDNPCLVSVVPQGIFHAFWANFGTKSALRSTGGTGAVVFAGERMLVSRQPRLWDIQSPERFASWDRERGFADTATQPGPNNFGPAPLAPVLFDMVPGQDYLVWFYIWQLNQHFDSSFLSMSTAKVPAVSVSVSAQLNLH